MTKRCKDCGVIFQTDNPDKERCDLFEDDRKNEDDAETDYRKNWYRIRRYGRRYINTPPGFFRTAYGLLIRFMNWINEKMIRGCDEW